MKLVSDYFGCMVFDDKVMKSMLSEEDYNTLKRTVKDGRSLNLSVANAVASAMKDWAISLGATHYTHWFQPMTGITAEKHDSFIAPDKDGRVIMEFSGKELIRGETDASSFPSGGLRATFEARGYTAWDATSYAFIKDGVLCIPTAFCSYSGDALDKKTPLLRSMEAINRQAMRVLKLFGNEEVTSVKTTVGPEQEYFLIDKEMFKKRKDLVYTGRTLFGAKPAKSQELEGHYYGVIKPRVQTFMNDLNEELWKLGVLAKTEHNEAAPAQHELAPIFATTNIAADHNQLTMEIMQKIAKKHDMVCLLHEKPFEGVNGSGKHNNWSISTNTGVNLLEPGDTPAENAQFLLFLCAVIKAVDEYQDLLRVSVASAGNDHRLGANEAPPAVVSIFLGGELMEILEAIEQNVPYGGVKEKELLRVGVHTLPKFPKDTTDRNRTSPFAFTGNKFEFRMLGSSASVSGPNTIINTAVAEILKQFADELETAENFETSLHDLIRRVIKQHKRILFNGNGYDDAWLAEAEKRGLLNLKSTPDALPYFVKEKNVQLFTSHKVYTEREMHSRLEILLGSYCNLIDIEAQTMVEMAKKEILPAVSEYSQLLSSTILSKKSVCESLDCTYESEMLTEISDLTAKAYAQVKALEKALDGTKKLDGAAERSVYYKDEVLPVMEQLRAAADGLETVVSADYWPIPTYGDLLFGV
ncbi:MAG: glutamine synthetase III [Clostridia bacterium]|nr:glutamine synthetase III [Clostridia bacterium]